MEKAKKLTIKHLYGKDLYKISPKSENLFPVYVIVIFDRKATKFKSPSFDLLIENNIEINFDKSFVEKIIKNDIRLFENIRNYCELNSIEFSVDCFKKTEPLYIKLSSSIITEFSGELAVQLYNWMSSIEENKNIDLSYSIEILEKSNPVKFFAMIEELSPELFSGFREKNQMLFIKKSDYEAKTKNFQIPFLVDFLLNDPIVL